MLKFNYHLSKMLKILLKGFYVSGDIIYLFDKSECIEVAKLNLKWL